MVAMKQASSIITIGVSGASATTKSVRAMMKQIEDEGANAVFLVSRARNLRTAIIDDLSKIQALVLMGNNFDIDPKIYLDRYEKGDPKRKLHPATKSEMSTPRGRERALYETAMLQGALAAGMPVLGICGGMQRINVLCGGTLHQHVPDLVGCDKHMQSKQGIAPHIPVVPIVILDNTKLSEIACDIAMPFVKGEQTDCPKVIMENSLHHQAVDKIAPVLRVCAVTDSVKLKNGTAGYLAEAIESNPDGKYKKQFILGVQWHPEFGASSLGQRIVQHLMASANDYGRKKPGRKNTVAFKKIRSVQTSKKK